MSRHDASRETRAIRPVLLAAGAGSRYSDVGHKLTAGLSESSSRPAETVFERALASLRAAAIGCPTVVTGKLGADDLGIEAGDDLIVVHNHDWARGQMTSVRAAISSAEYDGAEIVVIGLADQPGIEPAAWQAVAGAAVDGAAIAVATYGGRRANPVALHRDTWGLLPASGDEGARTLMRLRPDLVVEVPCSGSPKDIDTVEDLTTWQNN